VSSESLAIPLGFSQKILVIDTLPVGLREELAGVINQGLFAKVGLAAFRKASPTSSSPQCEPGAWQVESPHR
jgi:hypothetical protein